MLPSPSYAEIGSNPSPELSGSREFLPLLVIQVYYQILKVAMRLIEA